MAEKLQQVIEAVEELTARLTEGHQLLKDMKQERKRLEEAVKEAKTVVPDVAQSTVQNMILERVEIEFDEMGDQFSNAIIQGQNNIQRSFDKQFDAIMYGSSSDKSESIIDRLAKAVDTLVTLEKRVAALDKKTRDRLMDGL